MRSSVLLFGSVLFLLSSGDLAGEEEAGPLKITQLIPPPAAFAEEGEYATDPGKALQLQDLLAGEPISIRDYPHQLVVGIPGSKLSSLSVYFFLKPTDAEVFFEDRMKRFESRNRYSKEETPLLGGLSYFTESFIRDSSGRTSKGTVALVANVVFEINSKDEKYLEEKTQAYLNYLGKQALQTTPLKANFRMWTSSDGKKIEGRIKSYDPEAGTIDLERKDGQVFEKLPLDRLIATDQEMIKDQLPNG